jgi:hypothetical protein
MTRRQEINYHTIDALKTLALPILPRLVTQGIRVSGHDQNSPGRIYCLGGLENEGQPYKRIMVDKGKLIIDNKSRKPILSVEDFIEWALLEGCNREELPVLGIATLEKIENNLNRSLEEVGIKHLRLPLQFGLQCHYYHPTEQALPTQVVNETPYSNAVAKAIARHARKTN